MKYTFLLTVFSLCILHLNGAKKINAVVTLHHKNMLSLFSEDEIWGIQYKNKTEGIVEVEVVINESKFKSSLKNDMIIAFDIIWPDVEEAIRKERSRINNRTKWTSWMRPDIFFQEYHSWVEIVAFLDVLLLRFPDISSRSYMGQTIEGRNIPVITLSTGGEEKPGFYIQAEIHAREWLANSATIYILNALAEAYGNDERITNILDSINFYFVPTLNIDGYVYTWTDERLWRKNRRNNDDGTFGVDLNRNYDGPANTWCTSGASTDPSSNTYCGTSPFSEPETAASANFIMNPAYNISVAIDMHTYGPLILWPWGYVCDQLPPIFYSYFVNLGAEMQQATFNVHGIQYESAQWCIGLYPASGDMTDFAWGYGNPQQQIVSFTIEGRGPSFVTPPENIVPAGQEQLAAILTAAETLINNLE